MRYLAAALLLILPTVAMGADAAQADKELRVVIAKMREGTEPRTTDFVSPGQYFKRQMKLRPGAGNYTL